MKPLYLTEKQILLIHSLVVDETGGAHGIRDHSAISSVVALPRQTFGGAELYPTLFDKAAVYARSIILNHPFLDGNKRTGMTAAIVFLEDNGYMFQADEGAIERYAVTIPTEKPDIESIAAWLEKNCT